MPKVSEEHRNARRDQIVDAMLRCVARQGFHKTTMSDVVAESGLSAGAVYLYFKGKDDLIRAIVELVVGEGLSVTLDSAEEVPPPPRVLAEVLQRIIGLGERRGIDVHRVAVQAWAEAARNPEIRVLYRREGERGQAAWVDYVERAIAAGHLSSSADPARTAHLLIGLIPGFMMQRLVFDDLDPAVYAAGLADLMGARPGDPGRRVGQAGSQSREVPGSR